MARDAEEGIGAINYAAVVASTTDDDIIAVCDAGPSFRSDTLTILADVMPESYWATLLHKQQVIQGIPPTVNSGPSLPAYIALPEIGYIASIRRLGEHRVKVLVMGNKAGAGYTHEDKGSFVLKYADQTFAMDLGICDYSDPIHVTYKHCQRHNMFVPVGMSERAHPQNPLPYDVKPTGRGDEQTFRTQIDATLGWNGYYKKWVRTWDSPSPEVLTIRDEYELAQGNAVEFYWQTNLPVEQTQSGVIVRGNKGIASLTIPPDCTVRLDRLPLAEGADHARIAIQKPASQGTLETSVTLRPATALER